MSNEIGRLERLMAEAASALDFEEARRLRDQINLLRGGASASEAASAETSDLLRQRPGAMGIGTSQPKPEKPEGWKAPRRPDPLTKGRSRSKR